MTGSGESADPVREFLSARAREGRMPGAAWWVGAEDGPVSHGAVGFALLEPTREPATPETPFDLASLTKPLGTAVLAAGLAEDVLPIDDPVARFVPEVAGSPYAEVTLRELGAHRGGLPAWRPLYLQARDAPSYARRIASEPPACPRGASLYSDLGYLLLGFAIARAAGRPLDALFETRVASPLGLRRTGYAGRGGRFPDAAATERGNVYERRLAGTEGEGYAWRETTIRGTVHDGNAWGLGGIAGHAGLFGTAEEVARIALAVLRPERLGLGRSSRDLWLRPATGSGGRSFGWLLARDSDSARGILEDEAVGHLGFTGTSVFVEPASGRVHVLLANRVHPEVPSEDFTEVRRGFHRAAAGVRPA